jgi:type III secretion protein S
MPESLLLLQHALLVAFKLSVALALIAACAGMMISVVLSAFQIQDQTLPFAVKLIVVGIAVAVTGESVGVELLGIVDQALELVGTPRG